MKLNMLDVAYYAKMGISEEIKLRRKMIANESSATIRRIYEEDIVILEEDLGQVNDIIDDLSRKFKPNLVVTTT